MTSSSKQKEAARCLHEWAVNEMHFVPQGRYSNSLVPSQEQFTSICRGQLADIWKYITQHVHSAQTTATVKGNLDLHKQSSRYGEQEKYSESKAKLLEERKKLRQQLKDVSNDEDHVTRDVKRLHKEVSIGEEDKIKLCSDINDVRKKTRLLNAHSLICKTDIARYEKYKERLIGRLRRECKQEKTMESNTVFFSRKGSKGSETLETACTKGVRDACEDISNFLKKTMEANVDTDKIKKNKETIWKLVGKAVTDNQPLEVVTSLTTIAEETGLKLNVVTNSIDLMQDAETLRFKFASSGHLNDMSMAPDNMKSVNQLILKRQIAHINQFTKTEKCKNDAYKLDQNLLHLNDQIKNKSTELFKEDMKAVENARKLFSLEINVAATSGTIKCLNEQIFLLTQSVTKATKEREILHGKYKQIQNFMMVSDDKQSLIKSLVRQNRDAKSRHEKQKADLLKYMQERLCSHKVDVSSQSDHLQNGILTNMQHFTALSFSLLEMFQLEDNAVKVQHLSLNSLGSVTIQNTVLQTLVDLTQFPIYKAPECLLTHLVELKVDVGNIKALLESQNHLHSILSNNSNQATPTLDTIAFSQDVREFDAKQLKMLLPVLQTRLSETSQGLAQCIQVKDYIADWLEQPSQHLTPWVQAHKQTYQEWLTKWTVTVTRLRQISQ